MSAPTDVEIDPIATTPDRAAARLLLDRYIDRADADLAAHLIVDAPPGVTIAAAKALDLLEVRTPLLTASFWVRGIPAKVLRQPEPPPPEKLTLEGDLPLPGWMVLDEDPGHEIVFGAIGVFWTPTIRWNVGVAASEFAGFEQPGWGKIACSYSVRPYGAERALLTYECRTLTTDEESRREFGRYWWLIRPFVQHIMNATVRTIAARAEAAG